MVRLSLLLLAALDFLFISTAPTDSLPILLLLTLPAFVGVVRFQKSVSFQATDAIYRVPTVTLFAFILAFYAQHFWLNQYFLTRAAFTLIFCLELMRVYREAGTGATDSMYAVPTDEMSVVTRNNIRQNMRGFLFAVLAGGLFAYGLSLIDNNPLEVQDSAMPMVGTFYLLVQTLILIAGALTAGWLLWMGNKPLPDRITAWRKSPFFDYTLWLMLIGGLWLILLRPVIIQKNAPDSWFVGIVWTGLIFTVAALDRDWKATPLKISQRAVMVFLVGMMLALGLAMVFFLWFSIDETVPYYEGYQVISGRAEMYSDYGYRMLYMPGTYYFPAVSQWLTGWVMVGPRMVSLGVTFLTWGLLAYLVYRKTGYAGGMLVLAILLASPLLNEKMVVLKGYYPYALTLVLSLVVLESQLSRPIQAALLSILTLFGLMIRHSPIAILGAVPLYILIFMGWRSLIAGLIAGTIVAIILLAPFSPEIFERPLAFFTDNIENLAGAVTGETTPESSSDNSFFHYNRQTLQRDTAEFFLRNPIQSLLIVVLILWARRFSVKQAWGYFQKEPAFAFAAITFFLLFLSHALFVWFMAIWQGATVTSYQVYFNVLLVYIIALLVGQWIIPHQKQIFHLALVFGLPLFVIFATSSTNFTTSLYGFIASHNDSQIDRTLRGANCLANYITAEDTIFYGNWDAGPLLYHPDWQILPIPLDMYFSKIDSQLWLEGVSPSLRNDIEQMDDMAKYSYWDTEMGINWLMNEADVVITLDKTASYPYDERHGQTWLDTQQQILDDHYELMAVCPEREPLAVYRRK